jgi:hypothetical protein
LHRPWGMPGVRIVVKRLESGKPDLKVSSPAMT